MTNSAALRGGAQNGAFKGAADQPREGDGTFGEKRQSTPEVAIAATATDRLAGVKDEIQQERDGRLASMKRELQLSSELLTIAIRKALPTAATLRLSITSPYPEDEPFLEPAAIYDTDGKELWIHTSDDRDNPSAFLRSIAVTAAFVGENTPRVQLQLEEGYTGVRLG